MQISTTVTDARMTATLSDRMTFSDHAAFRSLLATIAAAEVKEVVFDLDELVSIDSAGLGMFMIALEASEKHGWQLSIQRPTRAVRQLLQLARIDRLISVAAA